MHHLFAYGLIAFVFSFFLVTVAAAPRSRLHGEPRVFVSRNRTQTPDGWWAYAARELAAPIISLLRLLAGLLIVGFASWLVADGVRHLAARTAFANLDGLVAAFVAAHRGRSLFNAMWHVTLLGSPWFTAAAAIGTGLAMRFRTGRWHPMLLLIALYAGAVLLEVGLKLEISRARPPASIAGLRTWGSSFPSGHAERAAAIYGAFAWLLARLRKGWRRPLWIVAAILALMVGVSRVYLGVHWTTDVIGGWIIGAVWLAVVIAAMRPRPTLSE